MNLFEPYMRIPYLNRGRDHQGCDCWGIVRLIFKEELNVELPSYSDIDAHDAVRITAAFKEGEDVPKVGYWRVLDENEQIAPFDVVLMKWIGSKVVGHIGIITDDFKLLHSEEFTGPIIVGLDNPAVIRRVVKFARWIDAK